MNRPKFPEKIPFRLTRMLINAMEVSGIEGSYRATCERTMGVLRDNRGSLIAMLEAFVYDPLISWRLIDKGDEKKEEGGKGKKEKKNEEEKEKEKENEIAKEQEREAQTGARAEAQARAQAQAQAVANVDAGKGKDEEETVENDKVAIEGGAKEIGKGAGKREGNEGRSEGGGAKRIDGEEADRRSKTVDGKEEGKVEKKDDRGVGDGNFAPNDDANVKEVAWKDPSNENYNSGRNGGGGSLSVSSNLERYKLSQSSLPSSGKESSQRGKGKGVNRYEDIAMLSSAADPRIKSLTGGEEYDQSKVAKSMIDDNRKNSSMLLSLMGPKEENSGVALNSKALDVIKRVRDKLQGTDFGNEQPVVVGEQVGRLILQATSKENLCMCFIGWCAFW